MKKIIFILTLFVSFVANSQYTPPPGYTNINSSYDWLAGVFRALRLPAGGNAAFTAGQAQRAGSVYYDSTGADAGLKVWNGAAWVGVGEVTQSALDDTAAAIRGDFPALVNIYNSDGTLSGNRTITLSGNYLRALQGATEFLLIDPTTNNEAAVLQAHNTTGAGNNAAFNGTTTATNSTVFIATSFNGATQGRLTYTSDNTGSLGAYVADLHEFTGDMRLASLAGNGTGIVEVDNLGNLTWVAAPNLLFDSLGAAGISPVTVRDDTLMSRRISVTGGLTIDTTASGGLVIDASGVSGGGGGISEVIAGYGLLNVNDSTLAVDTLLISTRAWRDKLADSLGAIIDAIPAAAATGETVKTMYLSSPTTADDLTYYYIDSAITVTKVADVLTGTSPSVTYNVFFAATRNSGTPDSLFSAPRVSTSITGATTTTFNDNTIPAGSWIWLKTYATSGTVNDISVNLLYPGGGGGGSSGFVWGEGEGTLADQTDLQAALDAKQPKDFGIIQSATYTLTSTLDLQKLFDVTYPGQAAGELPVAANTTYQFECIFSLTSMSGTSGNCGFDVLGAGTATFTSANWVGNTRDITLGLSTAGSNIFSPTAAVTGNIGQASTATEFFAHITGTIRVNAGGTIIPSTNLTTASAAVVGVNSYFKLTPIGSGSITSW